MGNTHSVKRNNQLHQKIRKIIGLRALAINLPVAFRMNTIVKFRSNSSTLILFSVCLMKWTFFYFHILFCFKLYWRIFLYYCSDMHFDGTKSIRAQGNQQPFASCCLAFGKKTRAKRFNVQNLTCSRCLLNTGQEWGKGNQSTGVISLGERHFFFSRVW